MTHFAFIVGNVGNLYWPTVCQCRLPWGLLLSCWNNDCMQSVESCEVTSPRLWLLTVQVIEQYLTNTHAPTHTLYRMKLIDVFEVQRDVEVQNFVDHGNRLSWHWLLLTLFFFIVRLHYMPRMERCGLLLLMFRGLCVCLSGCSLDITTSCAITAEPIKMLFGIWTQVGSPPPRGEEIVFGGSAPCDLAFC